MSASKIPALFLNQTQGNLKGNLKHQTGGGRYTRVNLPPPYFFRPFLPPPYISCTSPSQSCYWRPGDGAFPWQLWALPPSSLREIKQKIERKKLLTCSIPCLLIALIAWQLEILVTMLIKRARVGFVGVGWGCWWKPGTQNNLLNPGCLAYDCYKKQRFPCHSRSKVKCQGPQSATRTQPSARYFSPLTTFQ